MKNKRLFIYMLAAVLLVPECLWASPYIVGKEKSSEIARIAGVRGSYVTSADQIPDSADVVLLGDIYTAPDNAPLDTLKKKNCRMIRIESVSVSLFVSRLKAYVRYTDAGRNVFDNVTEGMNYILYPNLIGNLTETGIEKAGETVRYAPSAILVEIPDTGSVYIPSSLASFAKTGRTVADINFGGDSDVLDSSAVKALQDIAKMLKSNSNLCIIIEGHADYNPKYEDSFILDLSRRRAENARNWLIKNGVSASQLKSVGYGATKPIVVDDTRDVRPENRRIEVVKN